MESIEQRSQLHINKAWLIIVIAYASFANKNMDMLESVMQTFTKKVTLRAAINGCLEL